MKNQQQKKSRKIADRLRLAYQRMLKMRGEPREIALGFALGIMVGMSPFLGFHTIIALFLAAVLKWNKLAAAVAVFITNPITAPVIYPITYLVGKTLVGMSNIVNLDRFLSLSNVIALIKNSPRILVDLTVGGIVVGLPLSILAYYIVLKTVENYRKRIKPKITQRRQARKARKNKARRRG